MLLLKVTAAYDATTQMLERELPYNTAHSLVVLRAGIKTHYDYYSAEESKLIIKYAKKDESGNPLVINREIQFDGTEDKNEFTAKRNELASVEVEITGVPVKIAKPSTIRGAWLEVLDGLVEFV